MNNEVSADAIVLLTREVLCEQIYRQRDKWDPAHPNNSLSVRDIAPEEIVPHVHEGVLDMNKSELRTHAAEVLDRILAARTLDPNEKLVPMTMDEVESFRVQGFIYAVNKLILHHFGIALAVSYPETKDPLPMDEPIGVIMMKTPSGQHIVFDEEHEEECKQRLEQTLKLRHWDNAATKFIFDHILAFPKKDYDALRDAWLEQNSYYQRLAEVATRVEPMLRALATSTRDDSAAKLAVSLANDLLAALGREGEIKKE